MTSTLSLQQVVGKLESGDDWTALRYEPDYPYLNDEITLRCKRSHTQGFMSTGTAHAICKFSYGRFQIMGGLLYELGYTQSMREFLNSPLLQTHWFEQVLKQKGISYSLKEIMGDEKKMKNFARKYNGDSSGVYAERIRNTALSLGY